jgi:hypothetical protein
MEWQVIIVGKDHGLPIPTRPDFKNKATVCCQTFSYLLLE